METPKGARLVWWTRLNAWAKALLYRWLLSKNAAKVIKSLNINGLGVFGERVIEMSVAKSLQLKAKKKA
ncbi:MULTISPECIES: hypothetical protein [unclassified Pseudomonas]|jgi:hypothetical protein|uniref:hypothetical protein n=1 Tax=unclassified Pseudomonas TaxID=196821 RepID=UPI0011F1EBE4|nr:hypothetical protein [Pseudomonas sp. ANT_J12]KAA0995704.1 hypothetical protein FQ192_06575 [Pseudomonas sp. ANT_J12]